MNGILQRIKSPADVKGLSSVELERLAEEIRERLITGVAKTGGHIGPNLGVVELTIALHYVFDTPADSLIIVLIDNDWSIDKNVGAIAEYFHKLTANTTFSNLHDRAAGLIERFGGKAARHVARKAEEAAKGLIGPGMLFEEFGLSYYGPIDGHNLPLLIETFKFLKQQNKPVVLHAITQKGRGFQPALEKQKKFHGLGPYDPESGETKSAGQKTYSEIFAESLTKLANQNEKVVAITAAMPNGTALDLFRPHHPTRYFDVGIAEEHA